MSAWVPGEELGNQDDTRTRTTSRCHLRCRWRRAATTPPRKFHRCMRNAILPYTSHAHYPPDTERLAGMSQLRKSSLRTDDPCTTGPGANSTAKTNAKEGPGPKAMEPETCIQFVGPVYPIFPGRKIGYISDPLPRGAKCIQKCVSMFLKSPPRNRNQFWIQNIFRNHSQANLSLKKIGDFFGGKIGRTTPCLEKAPVFVLNDASAGGPRWPRAGG